jgi:hypothetical protein
MHIEFGLKNLKGTNHLEDTSVDEKITLEWLLKWEDVNWIDLIQDRYQWWVVNMVMNLWVL